MKRIISIVILSLLIMQSALPVYADYSLGPCVTINGRNVTFSREIILQNGEWLFPFKELMGRLGFFIGYDEQQKVYKGEVNGAEAVVPISGSEASYDLVPIELDNPLQSLKDDVLVELRFIDMFYGIDCMVGENKIDFTARIFQDEKSKEKNTDFDVNAYLSSITPKSVHISNDSLFDAEISDPELISMRTVEVDDAPGFTRAVEVENLTEPRLYYDSQITIPIETSVSPGDVLYLSFWARKIKCVDESGFASFNTTYEALDGIWTKYHNATETELSEEWTKYTYPFVVNAKLNGGGAQLGFRIGFRLQTIQFGAVEVLNYGKKVDISLIAPDKVIETTYYGREEGALWREEALRRIEKYRKNDIKISVRDESGKPVTGAKISANMTKSEFLWGNAANHQKCFEGGKNAGYYQDIQAHKFNSFTCETGMKSGNFRMENCVAGVNFARENNLYFRAHAIFWDRQDLWPAELSDKPDEDEIKDACYKYASKLAYFFGDNIDEVDVLNEPLNNDVARQWYGCDFIADIFKMTRDVLPGARLFVNETGITGADTNQASIEKIRKIVDSLLEAGAPVDGIGIQNHAAGFIYPQKFYNALDYIAANLDCIAITEYDYLSKLPDTVDALEIEADYLRDSIILAYSHPKTTSFTMWGFTDHGHWRGNAPLYFASYNPKPALKYWDEYVWGEWFTNETAVTDENGEAVIRGHRGNYDITVEADGAVSKTTLVLTKDGENTVRAIVTEGGIELASSEEVPKKTAINTELKTALFTDKEAELAYLELYENKGEHAKKSTGENADFLLRDGNTLPCAVSRESAIDVKLKKCVDGGFIKLKTGGSDAALFSAEARSRDGEWKKIYAGESSGGEAGFYFENPGTCEIRISGLIDIPAMIKYISVSEKEAQ
ncbi:MAG: endo-1,4-beta-xylanase [Clostridia bacterium]|nr:endo-1,4-beta-xylanase [Clostridia bacterium]